jgi:hypothetical protein
MAPAPALSPATIAFTTSSAKIIDDILHSFEASPSLLQYMTARDPAALKALSTILLPYFQGRDDALFEYLKESDDHQIQVSEKTKAFWREKQSANKMILDVMKDAHKTDAELDHIGRKRRTDYFTEAKVTWEVNLRDTLIKLNSEIIGPFCLGTLEGFHCVINLISFAGDQLSLADLHLAAWLARIVKVSGGTPADDGTTAITKLGAHIGTGFALPKDFVSLDSVFDGEQQQQQLKARGAQNKLAAFWDAIKQRPSWKKVYRDGLI